MNKHLILVTRYFPPTSIVGAIRPFRLARYVAELGWSVDVVHGPHDFKTFEPDPVSSLGSQVGLHPIEKQRPRLPLPRVADKVRRKLLSIGDRLVGRDSEKWFIDGATKRIRAILSESEPKMSTVLVTTSPPHPLHRIGLTIKHTNSTPWVIDLRDPWDQYLTTGQFDQPDPAVRALESNAMEAAQYVVSTTNGYTEILRRRFESLPREKFETITNSFARRENQPKAKNTGNRLRIVYTGIFYPEKDPFTFFRAVAYWKKQTGAGWHAVANALDIVLVGVEDSVTPRLVADLDLSDVVRFIPRVAQHEALEISASADFLLIASGLTSKSREGWLPSKLFEYLGSRRPIIAVCRDGELAKTIRDLGCGFVFSTEDPTPIVELLDTALRQKSQDGYLNLNVSFDRADEFREDKVFAKYAALLSNAIESPV